MTKLHRFQAVCRKAGFPPPAVMSVCAASLGSVPVLNTTVDQQMRASNAGFQLLAARSISAASMHAVSAFTFAPLSK